MQLVFACRAMCFSWLLNGTIHINKWIATTAFSFRCVRFIDEGASCSMFIHRGLQCTYHRSTSAFQCFIKLIIDYDFNSGIFPMLQILFINFKLNKSICFGTLSLSPRVIYMLVYNANFALVATGERRRPSSLLANQQIRKSMPNGLFHCWLISHSYKNRW